MSLTTANVTLHIEGDIAYIALNRPDALNAMSVEVVVDFKQAILEIGKHDGIRAVSITAKGRAFCAGGDLEYLRSATPEKATRLIDPLHEAIELMTQLPVPVVAALHGVVAGAGISLALACDFILAAENTRFNLAYTAIGASPDAGASWHLPRLIGMHKSLELLLLSEPFDANEALQMRLINRVHPAEQLADAHAALLTKLAAAPTFALGQAKRLVRGAFQRTLKEQLDIEHESFCACTQTQDFTKGIEAFLNKRSPVFTGR